MKTQMAAAKQLVSGKATISGTLKNGLICGDAVITATEATPIPTDITVSAGYTQVYLYQNRLYTDRSLNSPLTSKSQIASGSSLYVADLFHDSTSLEDLLTPSKDNTAGVGCDEICVDLSNITKSNITNSSSATRSGQWWMQISSARLSTSSPHRTSISALTLSTRMLKRKSSSCRASTTTVWGPSSRSLSVVSTRRTTRRPASTGRRVTS